MHINNNDVEILPVEVKSKGPVIPNFFGIAERKRGTLRTGFVSVVTRGSTLWEIPKSECVVVVFLKMTKAEIIVLLKF